MIHALLLAAIAPLAAAATPAPAPTTGDVPEIGRVRANALCTTLRDNIAPTIVGFMKNDEIIGAGHRAFAKMGVDAGGTSAAAIDIDKLYLEQLETRLVHNLKIVDTLLSDRKRFSSNPATEEERAAVAMRDQLRAVSDSQKKALDLISGTLETEDLGQMQHDINTQMQSATGQTNPLPSATSDPVSFIGTAGLPDTSPVSGLPTDAAKNESTLRGHTIYDTLNLALEGTQATTAQREQQATLTVVGAANACRASAATPGASPSP